MQTGVTIFVHLKPWANEEHGRARCAKKASRDCSEKQKCAIEQRRGFSADLHVNPARDDEERADQHHETDIIAALMQDSFRLPDSEEIIGGRDGREKKGNEMIVAFPMMFQDEREKCDAKQKQPERQHD